MSDNPLRLYGPRAVPTAAATIYTVPSTDRLSTFLRDFTFSNVSGVSIATRVSIGAMSTVDNRIFDVITAANTTTSQKGLWVMNPGEILQAQQVTATAPVGASVANGNNNGGNGSTSGAWVPAADTLYILFAENKKTDAPDAVSSVTGNGTWTLITTATTGSIAAQNDTRLTAYYWYSEAAGASATTSVDYGVAQGDSGFNIISVTNVFRTGTSLTYPITPIIQSKTAADSAAPGATTAGLGLTFDSALTGGYILMCYSRAINQTSTPPGGYTEVYDNALFSSTHTACLLTAPPGTSTTVAGNTWSASTTNVRATIGLELAPSNQVNLMVNGVEVTP